VGDAQPEMAHHADGIVEFVENEQQSFHGATIDETQRHYRQPKAATDVIGITT
jgi:hypothetical protein